VKAALLAILEAAFANMIYPAHIDRSARSQVMHMYMGTEVDVHVTLTISGLGDNSLIRMEVCWP
jgi:hypothetical protein